MSAVMNHAYDTGREAPDFKSVGTVSLNSRIDMVFTEYCNQNQEKLKQLPDDLVEDIYQEAAVITLELLSKIPRGMVPNQGKIYRAAATYLDEWVQKQLDQEDVHIRDIDERLLVTSPSDDDGDMIYQ